MLATKPLDSGTNLQLLLVSFIVGTFAPLKWLPLDKWCMPSHTTYSENHRLIMSVMCSHRFFFSHVSFQNRVSSSRKTTKFGFLSSFALLSTVYVHIYQCYCYLFLLFPSIFELILSSSLKVAHSLVEAVQKKNLSLWYLSNILECTTLKETCKLSL